MRRIERPTRSLGSVRFSLQNQAVFQLSGSPNVSSFGKKSERYSACVGDIVSLAFGTVWLGEYGAVATPKAFRDQFAARVRLARERSGYSQAEIATLLGIKQSAYSKYEGARQPPTLMPHHLIPRFCLACRVDVEWLFADASIPTFNRRVRKTGFG
ncbi:helix-turn-helix domain-containing protein [Methyloceanibacter caenitepidi]|uniref:helix-turn-helix domain-containing protein n=1 Tax=Methyloceanibacter caenitepidi TaxID=1384459 RepID=UPI003CC7AA50